jgi:hypothetical protein
MFVQVYGCNHVAIEVNDIKKAVAFYQNIFNLEKRDRGEDDAFSNLGEEQVQARNWQYLCPQCGAVVSAMNTAESKLLGARRSTRSQTYLRGARRRNLGTRSTGA